jgi:hypothetical protein
MVDRTSNAARQFRDAGRELVKTYLEGSRLHVESTNLYHVGPIEIDQSKIAPFVNAVHDSYDLNPLELPVARAIDATGYRSPLV